MVAKLFSQRLQVAHLKPLDNLDLSIKPGKSVFCAREEVIVPWEWLCRRRNDDSHSRLAAGQPQLQTAAPARSPSKSSQLCLKFY